MFASIRYYIMCHLKFFGCLDALQSSYLKILFDISFFYIFVVR